MMATQSLEMVARPLARLRRAGTASMIILSTTLSVHLFAAMVLSLAMNSAMMEILYREMDALQHAK